MKYIQRITELLHQVPKAPEDLIPTGVSSETMEQFELRTGVLLPGMMRDWLSLTNGPCIGPGGFYGIQPLRSDLDMECYWELFPVWKQKKWLLVAGDGCGNYYIMPTQKEFGAGFPVLFIETMEDSDSPIYVVASDLEHFVVGILQEELERTSWPFDEKIAMAFDPQIVRCNNVSLPWKA